MAKPFIVETSARHVHVTKEDLAILFGADAKLTNKKDLSQPGQFACAEKVTIVGPKSQMTASILGPERTATQVEISATDARSLGIAGAPVRESGDLAGSAACKLVGPCGEVELKEGVIIAKRHIHFTPEDAAEWNVSDKEIVWVKVETPERKVIFGDVVCRVSKNYAAAMHLDTDEANAAGCAGTVYGEIVKL